MLQGKQPVLLCSTRVRLPLRRLTERALASIPVLAYGEIPPEVQAISEGTVELEKLSDVLYVGRPAGAQPDSTVELFKLARDSNLAVRSKVKLGRSSVSTIEVKEGLQEGDAVVLSDMTAWDTADRVRLR